MKKIQKQSLQTNFFCVVKKDSKEKFIHEIFYSVVKKDSKVKFIN